MKSLVMIISLLLATPAVIAETADCRTAMERVASARAGVRKSADDLRRAESSLSRCEADRRAGKQIYCDGLKSAVQAARQALNQMQEQLRAEEKNQKRQCK